MHVYCRHAQFLFEKISVSRLIVLMPSAIPVQRSACELGDDPALGVQTILVLEKGYLLGWRQLKSSKGYLNLVESELITVQGDFFLPHSGIEIVGHA